LEKLSWQNKGVLVSLVIGAVLLFTTAGSAGQVGGLSGAYLRPPVGATALAMGGANTASPDFLASWWNPAVLANLREKHASAGIGFRSMGRSDAFGSFEFRVPPRLGVGVTVLYRGDPFINDLYDENENKLPGTSYTTFTGKIGLSYYVSRKLSAGASIGIHYQRLPINYDEKWVHTSATSIGSFDFALSYKWNKNFTLGLVTRDFFSLMTWNFDYGYGSGTTIEDRPLPSITLASKYNAKLFKKPLIWTTDLKGYLFDGEFKKLDRPEAYLSTGAEWQNWKSFYLRAGLGEILINGDLQKDSEEYLREFPFKFTAGLSVDLSKHVKGLFVNYGMATDKTGAGIDQQLDVTYRF
jgi:hypothetical protein